MIRCICRTGTGELMDTKNTPLYLDFDSSEDELRQWRKEDLATTEHHINKRSRQCIMHAHPFYEMILILSGQVNYLSEDGRREMNSGELLWIPPDTRHMVSLQPDCKCYDRLIVHIDPDFLSDTVRRESLPPWDGAAVSADRMVFLDAEAVSSLDLRALIERFDTAGKLDAHSSEVMLRSLLLLLYVLIGQLIRDQKVLVPAASNELIGKAISFLHLHYTDADLNVEKAADRLFISREHLSRLFREYTGETIHDYLTGLRLERCRERILTGEDILVACMESGFAGYNSFYKACRQAYHCSPSEWRRKLLPAAEHKED